MIENILGSYNSTSKHLLIKSFSYARYLDEHKCLCLSQYPSHSEMFEQRVLFVIAKQIDDIVVDEDVNEMNV